MIAVASNIKRLNNPRILAFFSLELPSGAILNSCLLTYSQKTRQYSVIAPQIPIVDDRGAIKLDFRGEPQFTAALSFRSTRMRRHFEYTAIEALKTVAPDLFAPRR